MERQLNKAKSVFAGMELRIVETYKKSIVLLILLILS